MRDIRQDSWPRPTRPPTVGNVRDLSPAGLDTVAAPVRRRVGGPLVMALLATLTVLFAAGLVSITSGPAEARSAELGRDEKLALIAQAEISTVRVAARACPGAILGSGFVVDDLLFTAKHLVAHDDRVKVDRPGRPVLVPIIGATVDLDIAVARADDLVAIPLLMASTDPPENETVLVAGFPDGDEMQAAEASILRYADASVWGMPGQRVMLLEVGIRKGFSGGPVLNRDGELVGLLTGQDQLTGLAVAIPADELREIIELAGSTWSSETGSGAVTHLARPCSG